MRSGLLAISRLPFGTPGSDASSVPAIPWRQALPLLVDGTRFVGHPSHIRFCSTRRSRWNQTGSQSGRSLQRGIDSTGILVQRPSSTAGRPRDGCRSVWSHHRRYWDLDRLDEIHYRRSTDYAEPLSSVLTKRFNAGFGARHCCRLPQRRPRLLLRRLNCPTDLPGRQGGSRRL